MLKRTLAILVVLVLVLSFSATALAGQKGAFFDDDAKLNLPEPAKEKINTTVKYLVPDNATPANGNPFEVAGR